MPSISAQLDQAFRQAIREALGIDAEAQITLSANDKFGDYQSNAAMGLAKTVSQQTGQRTNPRAIASQIVEKLKLGEIASDVSIAGPGFINVRLSPAFLAGQLQAIVGDARLGMPARSQPQSVVVDYSGPNVAKEMHVGHLRSTIIGDSIVRVLLFQGDRVIRQNHIGDWGTQFGMLIAYLNEDEGYSATNARLADLEDFYRHAKARFDSDPAFQQRAREAVVRLQGGAPMELDAWRTIVEETRRHYLPIYRRLDVLLQAEDERGESFYNPKLGQVVQELRDKGLAVESSAPVDEAPQPDGADAPAPAEKPREDRRIAVFVPGYEQPLVIQKTDGGYLYATTDLAAIRFRVTELGAQRIIYTHDSRQAQHFAMVFAVARLAGWAQGVQLDYAPFGTMLGEDGRPFKTREGGTVKLKDLLDEAESRALKVATEKGAQRGEELGESNIRAIAHAIGIGAVKYADLSKDRTSDYLFSWDNMLSLDGNTAPYLQYAYARIRSIFRKAAETSGGREAVPAGPIILQTPFELALAKHLLRLPEVIELVARELRPHHLCTYLYELATRFSGFFENCPVVQSPEPLRGSRLVLCDIVAISLALGLDLLGIEHPARM